MEDFSAEMLEMLQLGNKSEMENFIFEKYGIDLKSKDLLQLNLYNFIEHFLQEFSVKGKETDFLFNYPVSYTHLDVYKRQLLDFEYWNDRQVQFTIGSKFFARTRFSTEFQFGNQCRTFSNGSGG